MQRKEPALGNGYSLLRNGAVQDRKSSPPPAKAPPFDATGQVPASSSGVWAPSGTSAGGLANGNAVGAAVGALLQQHGAAGSNAAVNSAFDVAFGGTGSPAGRAEGAVSGSGLFDRNEFPSLAGQNGGMGEGWGSTTLQGGVSSLPSGEGGSSFASAFPALGSGPSIAQQTSARSKLDVRSALGPNFSMTTEDFPALSGMGFPNLAHPSAGVQAMPIPARQQVPTQALPSDIRIPSNEKASLQHREGSARVVHEQDPYLVQHKQGRVQSSRVQTPAGPSGLDLEIQAASRDRYGMRGLLKVVEPPTETRDMRFLALGTDLTALGLNLNSVGPLHEGFVSPWQEHSKTPPPTKVREPSSAKPDYKLPSCYAVQPPPLTAAHFEKLQLPSLWYIFYNSPRDILQIYAAIELHRRDWRYHRELKLWFTRGPGATTSGNGTDRPNYIFFDIATWERRNFPEGSNHLSLAQGFLTDEEIRHAARYNSSSKSK